MANTKRFKYLLYVLLVTSQLLIHDLVDALQDGPPLGSVAVHGDLQLDAGAQELPTNVLYLRKARRVKRKSKGGGFGFGRKSSRPKPNKSSYPKQPPPASYPKQPAHNPAYPAGGAAGGAPPAYPGTNSRPGYPAGAPPPYSAPGSHPSYPGAPPAYPGGAGHAGYPGAPPAYPGGGGYPNYGGGGAYGGNMGGNSFGKSRGGGLGSALGGAGIGAIAGTAMGAYGGYKLGRMVGGLGRSGHYGYYDDHGKYMRCEPPKNIKFDPETNRTYIPLEDAYDQRCSYYDRQPPAYYRGYTNGAGHSLFASSPINRFATSLVTFSFLESFHLFWQNAFVFAILAILVY